MQVIKAGFVNFINLLISYVGRSEVDDAAKCLLYTMQSCLSSNCETVLDFIPGLRAIYKVGRWLATKAISILQRVNFAVGFDGNPRSGNSGWCVATSWNE